ncbi:TIGR04086 family membrane protein [Peribacillus cavernae]|uniref:TIGR04086 family membrane protein n=2 Tax=Peribacillus cavernae TaxID=1674310 RepID=A0A433HHX7_9BACI|nr:TIGR04086 family membrane protein [Peribacillus cavernae]RUQ27855.1 TIGR04086 family membrane protein [Peribacillus cavernae]
MTIESKNLGMAILYGVGAAFALAIVASFIFSILLRFTSINESSLTYVIMAVSFISLFIGGFISGGKGKKQGWMLGGGTGILYMLIVLLFQYLGHDSLFSLKQWIQQGCFVVTAMMGGILGVNMNSSRNA